MKIKPLLLTLGIVSCAGLTQAQIQTAGTLFVNVDAASLTAGPLNDVANSGSLGGFFEARGAGTTVPLATNVAGVNAVLFDGSNDYLQLVNGIGGALVPPPNGVVGVNASVSVEVWVFNAAVGTEESMVSWGKRGTAGANSAFSYGYSGQFGAVSHHGTGATDLGWEDNGGAPLNNKWHHLVYTFDGTTTRVYSDGILLNSEVQSINVVTNSGLMLGAQWNSTGTAVGGQYGSLALAKVRIHDGALTAAQVLNNFNVEKATFVSAGATPALLSAGPTHRYSFSEAATVDATGLAFNDSVGTAHGVIQALSGFPTPKFTGSRLVLPGGPVATGPYADLPNGILSATSTNNSGSGEVSVEVWFKANGYRTWSHVFDFGSCGVLGSSGVELTSPGGNTGLTMLDDFMYGAQVSGDVNRHRLEWGNRDPDPGAGTTNSARSVEVTQAGVFNTDRHVVVTWKESTGEIFAYENGLLVATLIASNSISAINDINNWIGRSQYGDNTMEGEIDEFRIYNHVLTSGEALGNFQAGPDVVNTSGTLAISSQPQSVAVNQNFPATFNVSAGGTPPLYYQWLRNGSAISGETNRVFTISSAATADNGASYSVIVSNLTTSATSSGATLTVAANQSAPYQFLYERRDGNRDNYSGTIGGSFTVGANDVPVTHLGYYDLNFDGLNQSHQVGIWPSSGGTSPIGFVTVPAGSGALLTNGYRWVALSAPILLKANTTYILGAEVAASSGDGFPDNFPPLMWNSFFLGTNGFDTRLSRYGSAWPNAPTSGNQVNGIYGAPNLATMPIGSALAGVQQTTVTQYAGMNVTLSVAVGGQAPVSVQWYKAPGTLLSGKTNSSFTLSSVAVGDAGDYYAIASNGLGSSQSANITLVVLNDTPVSITQSPSNATLPEGFTATFSVSVSGTPPISYQWRRNGNAIPGATDSSYTLDPVLLSNNGDLYSCVASNFANSTPQLATSGNATLTVIPNKAPGQQVLHSTWSGNRDDFSGMIGGIFLVGGNDRLVTHLGYFDNDGDGLNQDHHVGIWPASGGTTPIAEVTVPAGMGGYLTNGYRYVALNPPVVLTNNTSYILGGESIAASGDGWPDADTTPSWDDYFVGGNAGTTRDVRYINSGWPNAPTFGSGYSWGANRIYGAPNMAVLPIGAPVAWVSPNAVTQYVGFSATLNGIVNGEAPIVAQWYKSPATPLPGQTNLNLMFNSLTLGDSGDYYLVASNTVSGLSAQSASATLTVLATSGPSITADPQSQSVYANSVVTFSGDASGTPPLIYQWTFNGNPLPGATNTSLTVANVSSADVGNYRLVVTNSYGSANSAIAILSLIPVPWGSYASSIMSPDLLVYYRLNDVSTGFATNQGSAGFAYNGTYEGGYSSAAGPTGFSHFEPGNTALTLDGLTSDMVAPSPDVTLSGATIAAWVYRPTEQVPDASIFTHRATDVFGLSTYPDPTTGSDALRYTWKGTQYSFVSGLLIPTNQWAFVAVSVTSDSATLYLQDGTGLKSATNVAAHGDCSFAGNSHVGWDSAGGVLGRRWNGSVDEVMVFNRPLSAVEINALYLGVPGSATLTVERSGNNLTLTWPGGVLLEADNVTGPWTPVNSATSPYQVSTAAAKKFYRVQLQP